MTAPIETAYAAFATALRAALLAAEFIAAEGSLLVDPEYDWSPEGGETDPVSAAALFRLETKPIRPLMGGGAPRYLVERTCQLELASAGPLPDGQTHEARLAAAVVAAGAIPGSDPTLGQTCERLELTTLADDDLPPNGLRKAMTFTIRLRAGDPLGLTLP